jgi:protein TonB
MSLALHAAGLGIVLFLTSRPVQLPPERSREVTPIIAPLRLHTLPTDRERSGGSNRTPQPPRRGTPPPAAHRTFIPPGSIPDPKLPMAITVSFDSPNIQIDTAAIGDPASSLLAGAFGDRLGAGIGNRPGGPGIGSERSGPPGISSGTRSRAATHPLLIFQVEPEFSEEARKAKYQGTVVLAIEVDTAGRPVNIRVLRGLGMGLDEKAIQAVAQWRFRPGLQNGKPIVTAATVEVNFRLL